MSSKNTSKESHTFTATDAIREKDNLEQDPTSEEALAGEYWDVILVRLSFQ